VTSSASSVIFLLHGEIDMATAGGIRSASGLAIDNDYSSLVVDASDVSFMDSHGVKALIDVERAMADAGGHLILRNPSPAVRRVLDLTGLSEVFLISA
jgi:anti-anti-sigma factor